MWWAFHLEEAQFGFQWQAVELFTSLAWRSPLSQALSTGGSTGGGGGGSSSTAGAAWNSEESLIDLTYRDIQKKPDEILSRIQASAEFTTMIYILQFKKKKKKKHDRQVLVVLCTVTVREAHIPKDYWVWVGVVLQEVPH